MARAVLSLVLAFAACKSSVPRPARVTTTSSEDPAYHTFLERMGPDPQTMQTRLREVEAMLPDSAFTLLAIAPQKPKTGERVFHGYPILGEAPASGDLLAGLRKDIARGGEKALCFWPRHALRFESGVEVLICFQCTTVEVHRGAQAWRVPLTPTVQAAFDEALSKSGFVRPPEREPLYEAPLQ
jgi:hypothetical protein